HALKFRKDPSAISALLAPFQGREPDFMPYGGSDSENAFSPEVQLGFETMVRNVALIQCGHGATLDRLLALPRYGDDEPLWQYEKRCRDLPDVDLVFEMFQEGTIN